ncbi:MAG: PilZ domain-containing protein [Armatimonadetes bacterium]|nr:PilZ domain-containing protein [Armatimonadota bacterium]
MSILQRLFKGFRKRADCSVDVRFQSRPHVAVCEAPEHRGQRRVSLGIQTQLFRKGVSAVACEVADASREGVRIVTEEPLAPNSIVGVVLHFNGCFLRLRARVVWSIERNGRFEAGAATMNSLIEDGGLLDNFARYLNWRATACAA